MNSNLQGSNLSASTLKYVMVDVAGAEDFVHAAIPMLCAVESDQQRSTTLVPLAKTSYKSIVLTMYQPQTSAMVKNQCSNLLNSQVPPKVPEYHNSTLGSQELFSTQNDIDAFEIVFLWRISLNWQYAIFQKFRSRTLNL